MMNKLYTIGRPTKDIELREVSGSTCANFTLASDTRFKDANGNPIANFYYVSAWGKAAESLAKYAHKGDLLAINGDVLIRQYKDNNGVDRTSVQITVSDFQFLNTKRDGDNASAPARPAAPSASASDELPF